MACSSIFDFKTSYSFLRTVHLPTSDEARLVDDAFIKICNMVNDLSMRVRAEAVGLLGSLHHVSTRFLEQTLDKKVMSHLKVRSHFVF
jgi:integrator complex subunit 4